MSPYVSKVVESVKSLISDQDKIRGQASLSISQFDHEYSVILENQDIHKVDINQFERMYQIGGATAFYDAALQAIFDMDTQLKSMAEPAKRVVIALVTDGDDCASKWGSQEKLKQLIEEKHSLGWDFLLLGADQNTLEVGEKLGIAQQKSALFLADGDSVAKSVKLISQQVEKARRGKVIEITDKDRAALLTLGAPLKTDL